MSPRRGPSCKAGSDATRRNVGSTWAGSTYWALAQVLLPSAPFEGSVEDEEIRSSSLEMTDDQGSICNKTSFMQYMMDRQTRRPGVTKPTWIRKYTM